MDGRSPNPYRLTAGRRAANAVLGGMIRMGVVPDDTQLVMTVGRRSGSARSTPVRLVRLGGAEYLVAPYGAVAWVHNARAAGAVTLRRGRRERRVLVREVGADEAGPVLARYVELAPATRREFAAAAGAPASTFAAEAGRHPVFALSPAQTGAEG